MAVPPVKSQPLHNFSLPHLKWAHKNSSSSASGSTSHQHRLRRHDSPDQRHHCYPDAGCNPESGPTTALPSNSLVWEEEDDNEAARPWNLRPRKEVIKAASNSDKGTTDGNNYNKSISSSNGVKSQKLSGLLEGGKLSGAVERKEKRKVWISLSREEIEEDVYALTGESFSWIVFGGGRTRLISERNLMPIWRWTACGLLHGASFEASRPRLGADLMPVGCF
ncbi:UNVERIFIED_CONTAM: hypothetical protein Sradi_5692900 [Sesamum radiatum]|uniref:Uncharacterized protein n=1 Tax=Sesamum radiatum TaxID=300843 RepID=A0AAW2L3W9_SESRA